MPSSISPSIGDPYANYVDDELGYAYHAWEVISAQESRRLQQILHRPDRSPMEQRTALEPLSDLERWALANKARDADQLPLYFDLLEPLRNGELDDPALNYAEILVDLARQHIRQDEQDEATAILDEIRHQWPAIEDEVIDLIAARLSLYSGDLDEAHQRLSTLLSQSEEFGDDVDLHVEIAEDFVHHDCPDHAEGWVERARQLATDQGDTASLVDLALIEDQLQRQPDADQRNEKGAPTG